MQINLVHGDKPKVPIPDIPPSPSPSTTQNNQRPANQYGTMAAIDYDDVDVNYEAFNDVITHFDNMMSDTIADGHFNTEDSTFRAMNTNINITAPTSVPTILEENIMNHTSLYTASSWLTPEQLKYQALSSNYRADAKKTSK